MGCARAGMYSPGKFEGEPCVTLFGYELAMMGDGVTRGDAQEKGCIETFLKGPFTLADVDNTNVLCCDDCYSVLLKARSLVVCETEQGFVSCDLDVDGEEWDKWWTAQETLEEEGEQ